MRAQETKMMTLEILKVMTPKTANYPYGRLHLMEMCRRSSPEMKTPDMPWIMTQKNRDSDTRDDDIRDKKDGRTPDILDLFTLHS